MQGLKEFKKRALQRAKYYSKSIKKPKEGLMTTKQNVDTNTLNSNG